ncbi:MAG: Rare lipoprotein A [uncultured bacterium]|nr:MAG: Rare lipoprotein A [uncultured bacterium]
MSVQLKRRQAIVAVFVKPVSSTVVQGTASWYDWTGAACNAFPIGSIIRVTNVATGASVESEVVSTGPFIPGRVVDLPREQFSQIADLSAGLAEVTVERIQ